MIDDLRRAMAKQLLFDAAAEHNMRTKRAGADTEFFNTAYNIAITGRYESNPRQPFPGLVELRIDDHIAKSEGCPPYVWCDGHRWTLPSVLDLYNVDVVNGRLHDRRSA